MSAENQAEKHGMVPGSHERSPNGPTCLCGASWDYWAETCTTAPRAERDAVTCPDGKVRHTRFVVLDCSVCRPECHPSCCRVSRPGVTTSNDNAGGRDE